MRFIPTIGEPDPAALEYLNRVFRQIPEGYPFKRAGCPPANLRDLIRREAEAIRKQALFRATIVATVETATGVPYRAPEEE